MIFTDKHGFDYGEVEYKPTSSKSAYLFLCQRKRGKRGRIWVPKNQVHPDSEVPRLRRGMLIVTIWMAKKLGWLDQKGRIA